MISGSKFYEDMKKELGDLKESATYIINEFESEWEDGFNPNLGARAYYENYLQAKHMLYTINIIETAMRNIYRSEMTFEELNRFHDSEYREKYGPTDEDVFNGIMGEFGYGSL